MEEELIGGSQLYDDDYRRKQESVRLRSEEALLQAEAQAADNTEVSVLIVDDQELVRNGFRLILSSYDNLKVVGEAANGREAYTRAMEVHPDVVLMDIRMPVEDGIAATARIVGEPELADTRVLVLTTFDIDEYVYDALSAGAGGFMLKDSEPDDIVRAIRTVARGDALIQPSITQRLIEAFVDSRAREVDAQGAFDVLTDREREIFQYVAHGLNNDQIAERLVISPATVKTHLARIMSKLNAHDRAQLVVLAYENGLVSPGSSI